MDVHLFFRKPTRGFRSLEELFDIVIEALKSDSIIIKEVPKRRITPGKVWANTRWVRKHRGKVNHITGDIHYIALETGRKTVLTIHDANNVLMEVWYKRFIIKLLWFWLPALLVKRITTISEKSKRELLKIVAFAKRKIRVIPNPYNPKLLKSDHGLAEELITNTSKPIVLHLGKVK